jgi:hypothetical protein
MQANDFDEFESFILLSTIERFKILPNILKEIANDS